jgi:hydroxymethylpyrimidine/phosphomethylpyrimidine kinase
MRGRVLVVAGSDSGGGAGLQADIKTITALEGYAATAVTALTAQNTLGVHEIQEISVDFVESQMNVVLGDIGADAIKCGMLHRSELIQSVVGVISGLPKHPVLVVDPVMYAKGGAPLLQSNAVSALKLALIPIADVITPNIPEAEALLGHGIENIGAMHAAAVGLLSLGPRAVLLKGGHMDGSEVTDILAYQGCVRTYSSPRVSTKNTHGTGCTLASAVAVGLAQKMSLESAVERARQYVLGAIKNAPRFGSGHGPLNHSHNFSS